MNYDTFLIAIEEQIERVRRYADVHSRNGRPETAKDCHLTVDQLEYFYDDLAENPEAWMLEVTRAMVECTERTRSRIHMAMKETQKRAA